MSEFDGKVVVVTGAAGALGSAVSDYFHDQGALVAQLDVEPMDNGRYSAACDLLDAAACQAAVDRIVDELGPVFVLANIAGGFTMGDPVHETSDETWDFMLGLNGRSVFHMARAVVPNMLANGGGRIISVGAGPGQRAVGTLGAYSVSKSIVLRLTEAMADELKEHNINVNAVIPGTIDTPANREAMPDADTSRWVAPAAIARVIGFLASDAAGPVHGAAVPVAGLG